VLTNIETVNVGSQRDMAMAFRRHLIISGVLGDVVSETYRRLTTPYEQEQGAGRTATSGRTARSSSQNKARP
jgi:hypothetical protein